MEYRIQITAKSLLLVLLFLTGVWFIIQVREPLFLLLLSGLLAAALYPAVNWLQRKQHFPQKIAILLFYMLFIAITAGVVLMITNVVIEQGEAFIQNFPGYSDAALDFIKASPLGKLDNNILATIYRNIGNFVNRILTLLFSGLDYLLSFVRGLLGSITILAFAFFLLSDIDHFKKTFLRLFPVEHRETALKLARDISHKVGAYVRGQLLVMIVLGILTWLGLSVIGIPYAFILGLIMAIFDIIPMIGPIFAAVIGILVALGQDPMLAIWATLIYIIAQQVENYLLVPNIVGRSVGLHPLVILFSILAGGTLFGVIGIVLAVPTAITVKILVQEFYLHRTLGETAEH